MLELVEHPGADIVTDAFLKQNTVLALKHGLLDIYKVVEGICLFCRVFTVSEGPYDVIEVFSSRYQERKHPGRLGRHRLGLRHRKREEAASRPEATTS